MNAAAVVLAAGSGSRMCGSVADKVLAPLAGRPVVSHTVERLLKSGVIRSLRVVVRDEPQGRAIADAIADDLPAALGVSYVAGGERRQDSVLNALEADGPTAEFVFIHDCARPLVAPADVTRLAELLRADCGAALARRVTDTIKRAPAGDADGPLVLEDLERPRLWAMETPQAFPLTAIRDAYRDVAARGAEVTDDAAAAARSGLPVRLLVPSAPNPKITTPEDLGYAGWLLERGAK